MKSCKYLDFFVSVANQSRNVQTLFTLKIKAEKYTII